MSPTLTFLLLMVPATFFLGLDDILVRRLLREGQRSEQLFTAFDFFTTAVLLAIPLAFLGIPELKPGFWVAITVTTVLNTFAAWGWYAAFKRENASLISPLRLLTPPLVIFTGYLVLREAPTVGGMAGIFLTMLGLWFLFNAEATFHHVPLREVVRRPGVLLGIAGAISFAISLPFDKQAVLTSSALFAVMFAFAGMGIGNALIVWGRAAVSRERPRLYLRKDWRLFALLAISHSVAAYLSFAALNFALAAYAASVKRLWSLWAVILSGHFLEEKNIGRKLLATAVMLAGIAVTVLLG